MVFGRESPQKSAFDIVLGLRRKVVEGNSFKSRDFSIIFYRDSISFSYLVWIAAMAVATADVTTLVIDC